jgi:hypothetical protein
MEADLRSASRDDDRIPQERGLPPQGVPVNPVADKILGLTCYPDVMSIPRKVDIVDVFRASEHIPPIAEEALAAKAECLWLQSGIVHDEAARKASNAGLYVIQDRCIATLHASLIRT